MKNHGPQSKKQQVARKTTVIKRQIYVDNTIYRRQNTLQRNGRKIKKAKQITIDFKRLQHLTHFTNGKRKNTQTHDIRHRQSTIEMRESIND